MSWDEYQQRPSISDRFSFSVQREIWARTILDASYLMNFIGRDGYTKNLNMMDPRLSFKYGAELQAHGVESVLQLRDGGHVPGRAAHAPTGRGTGSAEAVSAVSQPDAGWTNGRKSRYHTLELRAQRPFYSGLSTLAGYAYVRGSRQEFYDNVDEYDSSGRGPTRRIRAIG